MIPSKKTKSLMIRLSEEEHQQIKIEAAKRNISISRLVLQSIMFFTQKRSK
jgi:predicted HicB family RNase H-like nuclease